MLTTDVRPKVWNITVVHGDRWPALAFAVLDDTGAERSDYTPVMQVRTKAESGTVTKEFALGNGFTKAGHITTISDASPVNLPPRLYVYDFECRFSQGAPVTIFQGTVTVSTLR